MKLKFFWIVLLALTASGAAGNEAATLTDLTPEAIVARFQADAGKIDPSAIEDLPMRSHGRIKPFDTFARENILFLTGRYGRFGLDPGRMYLGLMTSPAAPYLPAIELRDPALRERLGLPPSERLFSIQRLESTSLMELAGPLLEKQRENERLLSPEEKKTLEAAQQVSQMRETIERAQFHEALILDPDGAPAAAPGSALADRYLGAVAAGETARLATGLGRALVRQARLQPVPELFRPAMDRLDIEIMYNHARPFFWAALAYGLLGLLLASGLGASRLGPRAIGWLVAPALLAHAAGFALRVWITGFAPVTSMYGTMVWMAFGVVVFGGALFALYRNRRVFGVLLVGAALALLLTESVPLILSPDMDPLVAVLRSNFWLTIHVMTISVSYAAFTIAMLIGNMALLQNMRNSGNTSEKRASSYRELAHIAYRIMQLGVFLLSTGIILGGWWADYSWGRFWGWDPKETWALIADLGFLCILHARHAGWCGAFGTLAAAPIAYLLVIMAWYGVNFILAAGLHSYGFSSGGATMVAGFVGLQLLIFAGSIGRGAYARYGGTVSARP